jgi:hypothetical protein
VKSERKMAKEKHVCFHKPVPEKVRKWFNFQYQVKSAEECKRVFYILN